MYVTSDAGILYRDCVRVAVEDTVVVLNEKVTCEARPGDSHAAHKTRRFDCTTISGERNDCFRDFGPDFGSDL